MLKSKVALFVLSALVFAACGKESNAKLSESEESVPDVAEAGNEDLGLNSVVGIYKKKSNLAKDYLYTRSSMEMGSHYAPAGQTIRLWATSSYGRRGIYRCKIGGPSGKHFVSADHRCEGQFTEGRLGYVLDPRISANQSQRRADKILYRCKDKSFHNAHYLASNCFGDAKDGLIGWAAP
jgi:hypothetical protein